MNLQLAQWLKAYITLHRNILESPSIHQHGDQNFYRYTTFNFILQYVLIHNQLMSTKKEISSLCKLYSVHKE